MPKIVHLQYDSKQKDQLVILDTKTTCAGKLAEMCQLSAVSEMENMNSPFTFSQKVT